MAWMILDTCTVDYVVFRLRHKGQKLPKQVVPHHRATGELRYYTRQWDVRPRFRIMAAQLLLGERYVIPILDEACVRELRRDGGLLISGWEVIPRRHGLKSNVDRYPQTWWCMPAHLVKPVVPDAAACRALAVALGMDAGEDDDDDALAWVRPEYLARKYPGLSK